MDATEEVIQEEIEILETIFIHELEIHERNESFVRTIKANLRPATGEITDIQWVCLELWLQIPIGYPDIAPTISIKNARGLSEKRLETLKSDLNEQASENIGMQVCYQLIQHCIDFLTSGNLPDCECCICLHRFVDADVILKTGCYHFFHAHCLTRYVKFQLEDIREKKAEAKRNNSPLKEALNLVCPMCRLEIPEDFVNTQDDAPPPVEQVNDAVFTLTPQLRELQQKMKSLWLKQKEQGGIIDIEGEKNKFFFQISTVATDVDVPTPPLQQATAAIAASQAQGCPRRTNKQRSSESSDTEDDRSNCRNRNRRGKNKMYPTPSEKKRAHHHALQQMRLESQNKVEVTAETAKVRHRPNRKAS